MDSFMQPPINLRGVLDTMEENTLKSKDGFQFSGLWTFSGSQGSGKTLLMMHLLKQVLEHSPNAIVISNISIFGIPCIPYNDIDDFEKYTNGKDGAIFVIDEIHTLFNSLESKNMPLSTMQVWCQNRKNRRLILGTSQRFTRVAKGVREQTTFNYECRRGIASLLYSYRVFNGDEYDDNGNYTGEEPKRHFYIPNVSVMRMYNTLEVVQRGKTN
jgi:hypothetical protein